MTERLTYYFNIWILMSKYSFLSYVQQRLSFVIFLIGKIIRFIFYTAFIFFLLQKTNTLAGYNLNQTLFFFLTFTIVDTFSQFLFRGVYRFRPQIVEGTFDLILLKPANALFRSLFAGADILDLITIPPLLVLVVHIGGLLNPTFSGVIFYILLIINALIISMAFHIAVISLAIVTLQIDHTIMIYRDLTSLGRFPIDIYKEPLKSALTFLIPVGIMVTFPAKVLMGLLSPVGMLVSFGLGILMIFISLKFWKYALRFYTSASS